MKALIASAESEGVGQHAIGAKEKIEAASMSALEDITRAADRCVSRISSLCYLSLFRCCCLLWLSLCAGACWPSAVNVYPVFFGGAVYCRSRP